MQLASLHHQVGGLEGEAPDPSSGISSRFCLLLPSDDDDDDDGLLPAEPTTTGTSPGSGAPGVPSRRGTTYTRW